MKLAFQPEAISTVKVHGCDELFPLRRIYCIGRNYAAHAVEMGAVPDREQPFYFLKPADNIVPSMHSVAYPPGTSNLHHEIELVVAIGRSGKDISAADALQYVYGYAVGNDLTRRDLQLIARDKGRPWEPGKVFDASAPIGDIHRVSDVGHPAKGAIWLTVNGATRQRADIADLITPVPELISFLSSLNRLMPGDLIFTGTPAGVNAIQRGDVVKGGIDGLGEIETTIV